MRNFIFYARLFAFLKSKSLQFLVLGCIISGQSLVAQTTYAYWQLDSYSGSGSGPFSWNAGANSLSNLHPNGLIMPSSGCVGNGISSTAKEELFSSSTGMHSNQNLYLTSDMAFEFLMKPNPTNGESKLLIGTQFVQLQWSVDKFVVTTLFNDGSGDPESFHIDFPFNGLDKASSDYYTNGDWHHILVNIIIVSNSFPKLELWVDGQKMKEDTWLGTTGFTSYRTNITGINPTNGSPYYVDRDLAINFNGGFDYDGYLDEIALYYDGFLDQTTILKHYAKAVKDNHHYDYSGSFTTVDPIDPYDPDTPIETDPLEFSPTINTSVGSASNMDTDGNPYNDAIEEFKLYPMPRFKKDANGDIPLLRNHQNYISPTITNFFVYPGTDPSATNQTTPQIVWGDEGGDTPNNPNPVYWGRTKEQIYKENMEYLDTELYDKWNYNLMINGFAIADACNPTTSNGLLIHTAMQNPSKPVTVATNMIGADGNRGISKPADFIYSPIEVPGVIMQQTSGTVIQAIEEDYMISFDNNNINCHIYHNNNGYQIRAWGYNTNALDYYIKIGTNQPVHLDIQQSNNFPYWVSPNTPLQIPIQIQKINDNGMLVNSFDFKLTGTEIFEWDLSNNPISCTFTRLGENSAALPVRTLTSYPLNIMFNYQSTTAPQFGDIGIGNEFITLLEPDGQYTDHKFEFSLPPGYEATIYSEDAKIINPINAYAYIPNPNLYYKIISNPITVTTPPPPPFPYFGGTMSKSYRIVLTNTTTQISYTIAFNLSKGNFLCLNTSNKCNIRWEGDMAADNIAPHPYHEIYLYERNGPGTNDDELITRFLPFYYHETWDALLEKAFLSPFATDINGVPINSLPPDFFKAWGFAYRDAYIVPFIEATGFNRHINMIAENGEVISLRTETGIDFYMNHNPGVIKDFYCRYSTCPNACDNQTGDLCQEWDTYVKDELYIGLDIERYMEDDLIETNFEDYCSTFANPPFNYSWTTYDVSQDPFTFMHNEPAKVAWNEYTTLHIYKPYITGYREGIFKSVAPIQTFDCNNTPISINYNNIIDTSFTDFTIYDLLNWNYTTGIDVTTKITVPFTSPNTRNYYNTNNLYVENLLKWNSKSAARNNGLENIRLGLQKALSILPNPHKFSSPYTTPNTYLTGNWVSHFEKGIQPGQWLGMLKYTAVTGAEFFYPFNYLQGAGVKASANNNIWQLTTSSYIQAITSRYIEIFRKGHLMQGDYPNLQGDFPEKSYTFNAHNPNILISAREWVDPIYNFHFKYIISGNIGTLTNDYRDIDIPQDGILDRFSPLSTNATIDLLPQLLPSHNFSFKVRRQGSIYYYERYADIDNNLNTNVIFYQLDGWHEYSHPYYWSKDFVFEAELFDNTSLPVGCGIRTVVGPAGNTTDADYLTTDFTEFKTYLHFDNDHGFLSDNGSNPANASKLEYNFEPRSTDNNKVFTYALNVRARAKTGTNGGIIYAYLDGTPVCSLTVSIPYSWNPYITLKQFSALANTNHTLTLGFSTDDIEIDSLKLGQDIVACLGDYIVVADVNAPSDPNYTYNWTWIDPQNWLHNVTTQTISIPNADQDDAGFYTLTVRENGIIIYTHTINVVINNLECAACPVTSDIEVRKEIYHQDANNVTFEITVVNHGCHPAEFIVLKDKWATGCFTYTGNSEQLGVDIPPPQNTSTNPISSLDIYIESLAANAEVTIYLPYNVKSTCQDCENCVEFVSFNGIETYSDNNKACATVPNELDTNPSYYPILNTGIGSTYLMNNSVPITPMTLQNKIVVVPEYMTLQIVGPVTMTDCEVIMMPGSKILVPIGKTLTINTTNIHGCTAMWAGIEVEGGGPLNAMGLPIGGNFTSNASDISDAAYGITLLAEGAKVNVINTDFMQNYVGIYIPPTNGNMYNANSYLTFSGNNTFSCNSILLPYYQGQVKSLNDNAPPTSRQYSYTGIEFHSVRYNLLPASSNASLLFQKMNNGFMAYRSNISMNKQLTFQDIYQLDPMYNDYDGSAIYVKGFKSHIGGFEYYGAGSLQPATIIGCHHGLYAEKMGFILFKDANLDGVDYGIKLRGNFAVEIYYNKMSCQNVGVLMQFNEKNSFIAIHENNITINSNPAISPAQYSDKAGIVSADNNSPADTDIFQNTIDMLQGQMGISLLSAGQSFGIHNNLINLPHNGNLKGISLSYTNNANVSCNEVIGDYGTGFEIKSCKDVKITCNIANETATGFYFDGTCNNTYFAGNYMRMNLHFGLRLSSSASIGHQYNTGNIWLGPFPPGTLHARYDNANPTYKFSVYPYSGSLLPNNRYPSASLWFYDDLNTNTLYTCNSNAYCTELDTAVGPGGGGGSEFTSMDNDILEGEFTIPEYEEDLQREAEAYLYDKIKDNPELQSQDQAIEDFYEDKSETNIGDFSNVKAGIRALNVSEQDSILNLLQSDVRTLLAQIYVNDSLLALATNALDSADIIAANIPLQDSINALQAQIQSISEDIEEENQNQADSLMEYNSGITTTRQMEDNEKTVNDIYLRTVARDIYQLDSGQIALLESIIYQCPVSGGSAVYKARSLYTLYKLQLWYEDSLCNGGNQQSRQASPPNNEKEEELQVYSNGEKGRALQVYPNPTSGEITFDFGNMLEEKQLLYIYNLHGQLIFKKEIDSDLSKVTFSFPNVAKGTYLYRIEGTRAHNGKIILE